MRIAWEERGYCAAGQDMWGSEAEVASAYYKRRAPTTLSLSLNNANDLADAPRRV